MKIELMPDQIDEIAEQSLVEAHAFICTMIKDRLAGTGMPIFSKDLEEDVAKLGQLREAFKLVMWYYNGEK